VVLAGNVITVDLPDANCISGMFSSAHVGVLNAKV
jgi:hypothetical protein